MEKKAADPGRYVKDVNWFTEMARDFGLTMTMMPSTLPSLLPCLLPLKLDQNWNDDCHDAFITARSPRAGGQRKACPQGAFWEMSECECRGPAPM